MRIDSALVIVYTKLDMVTHQLGWQGSKHAYSLTYPEGCAIEHRDGAHF